jgi:hypothetical protein
MEINNEIVQETLRLVPLAELVKAYHELYYKRKQHCDQVKICLARKRAQELGITVEDYLATPRPKGRPRKQPPEDTTKRPKSKRLTDIGHLVVERPAPVQFPA